MFAVPHATRSMIFGFGKVQGVAVPPQVFGSIPLVTRATLPLVPDIVRLVVVSSGVTGNGAPAVPAIDNWTR